MKNFRRYGERPYQVAVVHGGPGAAGEMAPVARELASDRGVLEPFQTARTLENLVVQFFTSALASLGNVGSPLSVTGTRWVCGVTRSSVVLHELRRHYLWKPVQKQPGSVVLPGGGGREWAKEEGK